MRAPLSEALPLRTSNIYSGLKVSLCDHRLLSGACRRCTSLQVLLNRKRIAEKGNLQADVVPMVRIPPNARERNQWVIKQAAKKPFLLAVSPTPNRRQILQTAFNIESSQLSLINHLDLS